MSIKEKVLAQVAELEAQGFKVTLDPIYLERIDTAVDDWDFADQPNLTLIRLEKDGKSVEADSQGERRVELQVHNSLGNWETVNEWHNALLDTAHLALLRAVSDCEPFEIGNTIFMFIQRNNGWFEDFYFVNRQQDGDTSDAYYDPPLPFDVRDSFNEREWPDASEVA